MVKKYAVQSIYKGLIPVGVHAGRPAVFIHLAGCLLCGECVHSVEQLTAQQLLERSVGAWGGTSRFGRRCAYITGGEPSEQLEQHLAQRLWFEGFAVHVTTNGMRKINARVGFLSLRASFVEPCIQDYDEVILPFPVAGLDPAKFRPFAKNRYLVPCANAPGDRVTDVERGLCARYATRVDSVWFVAQGDSAAKCKQICQAGG